jgi:hypothetical protein
VAAASSQQDLHQDFADGMLEAAVCEGSGTQRMAMALIIPAVSASSGWYVKGSHIEGAAGLGQAEPVLVAAGSALLFSTQLAHYGASGADLPAGVSERPALFACAHLTASVQASASPAAKSKTILLDGTPTPVSSFKYSGANNCCLGKARS